ncbi:MAG: hypothetical protein ABIT37_22565 [Luteolibacter sp.]
MKPTSFIPPVLSLLIVGGWIGSQRQSISAMEKESISLRKHIADVRASSQAAAGPTKKPAAPGKVAKDKESIDWKKLAAQMAEMQQGGGMGDMRAMMHFQQRMQSMTKEEMVAALEEIAALDVPAEVRAMLEGMILNPLLEKDPELALTRFIGRLDDDRGQMRWQLSRAMKNWAEKDPAKAQAWFDQQIAAGKFDSKALDGRSQNRIQFEGQLIGVLIGSDTEAAAKRLQAMPEEQRDNIMQSASMDSIKEDKQLTYADFIRGQLPEKEQAELIANLGNQLMRGDGFTGVDAYLDRIAATPEERAATATEVAVSKIQQDSYNKPVTRENLDAMREWVAKQAPGTADNVTGKALGSAAQGNRQLKFADAAALAQQYDDASGNQDVLAGFLQSNVIYSNRDQARELAQKITDEKRREEILKKLK